MIVLDASVLIATWTPTTPSTASWRCCEREIDDDLSASPLPLVEVLVGPIRAGRLDAALRVLRELEVVEQPFSAATATELVQLRALTQLRMSDCCVLLAAQEAAARVAPFDAALVAAAEGLGLTTVTS